MLPERNQKFQDYYAPAVATKAPWRLLVGLVVLTIIYFGFSFLFGGAVVLLNGAEKGSAILLALTQGADPKSMILLLMMFAGVFMGVLLAAKLVHKRGIISLLGQNLTEVMCNFGVGFIVAVVLSSIGIVLFSFIDPPIRNMELSTWLLWMILGVPLLLLQVSSEELVFRGYMQQQLAARFKSRWVWYVLPSVLFGMLHYQPDIMGSNTWIVVVHSTLFGLIAADITARTGNLGAAIGLHFGINLFALTIVGLDGSLSGLGMYKTAFHVSNEAVMRSVLIPDLIFIAILYGLFLLWCRNKPQW